MVTVRVPAIGERVPDFTLPDQYGKSQSLPDLMGPKGLLLVFTVAPTGDRIVAISSSS